MKNTMEYKGYVGSVELSEEDRVFFGQVMGIRSLISYEGTTVEELVEDFHGAIDDYLVLCRTKGIEPERSYGSNRRAVIFADTRDMSLNSLEEQTLERYM